MISVAAELVGMHPQTLASTSSVASYARSARPATRRLYSDSDVERLRLNPAHSEVGLNLAGVERVLHMEDEIGRMRRRIEPMEQRVRPCAPKTSTAPTGATRRLPRAEAPDAKS